MAMTGSLRSGLFGEAVVAHEDGVSVAAVHDPSLPVPASPSIGAGAQSLYGFLAGQTAGCVHRDLGAAGHSQFAKDAAHMVLDRSGAEEEPSRNLVVRQSEADQARHSLFAAAEHIPAPTTARGPGAQPAEKIGRRVGARLRPPGA